MKVIPMIGKIEREKKKYLKTVDDSSSVGSREMETRLE
jgi:hypothetical protein